MRPGRVLCALLLAVACARAPQDDAGYLGARTLPKDPANWVPKRDLQHLVEETAGMNQRLGRYPATFANEEEHASAYRDWRELLFDARVVARPADGVEARMWVLGELYRYGHDLSLRGAAELSDDNLSACVAQFPESVVCNGSLSMLYLSVKPTPARMERVERSLEVLRRSPDEDIAQFALAQYVHLRLVERDAPATRKAIDEYVAKYPKGRMAQQLIALRPRVDDLVHGAAAEDEEP